MPAGTQEKSRRAVVTSLLPIALGREASVVVVVVVLGGAEALVPATLVRAAGRGPS